MIIEKLYSDNNKTINESDYKILQDIIKKYDDAEICNVINEANGYGKYGGFNSTGGSKVKGISGAVQSIPSFLITAAISWPVALIAGIGALSEKMQRRWEDPKSWRNRLNPAFWTDYIANQGDRTSLLHRAAELPFKATGALATGAAAVLGLDAAKKKLKETSRTKDKKGWLAALGAYIGAKKAVDKEKGLDSSTGSTSPSNLEEILTPEDVKNIVFREFYITYSNGEVVRVKADTEQNAKQIGVLIASSLISEGIYKQMNDVIKNGGCRFKFYFDDGECCYNVGKNSSEVKSAYKASLKSRKDLCDAFSKENNGLMPLDRMPDPTITGSVEIKYGAFIEIPDVTQIKVSQTPPSKKQKKIDASLPKPPYKNKDFRQFRGVVMNFAINVPAQTPDEGIQIVKRIITNEGKDIIDTIRKRIQARFPVYNIKFGDGDIYYVAADSEVESIELAKKLYKAKIDVISKFTSNSAAYKNFLLEYGESAGKIKSTKVEKEFKFKQEDYISFTEITSPNEDNIRYQKVPIS